MQWLRGIKKVKEQLIEYEKITLTSFSIAQN
jgi:hypothetical protein